VTAEVGKPKQPSFARDGAWKNWLAAVLAAAWFPTRLIEEANPEWRLVSWALAVEVVGLSLLLAGYVARGLRLARVAFPLCFFLVAVPWPTLLEGPLIQAMTRANACVVAELLTLMGVPAIQQGNIIEVGAGAVGLDEACSGIRSLQAVLMISLLFGEVYELTVKRRISLCLCGFALSFSFNVGRTALLAWITAKQGSAAAMSWHDPAGVMLLLFCFSCLWALAKGWKARNSGHWPVVTEKQSGAHTCAAGVKMGGGLEPFGGQDAAWNHAGHVFAGSIVLVLWLLLSEVGVEAWYRAHEWNLPSRRTWQVKLPENNPTVRYGRISERARQLLRFNQGLTGAWQTTSGTQCQAIFLEWNPGRSAAHLAGLHRPDQCLTASGLSLQECELQQVRVEGLSLCFRSYQSRDERGPIYIFYTLWPDRGEMQEFDPSESGIANRIDAVLSGQRNCGQRSLELAMWGMADPAEAKALLNEQVRDLLRVN